MEPIWPKYKYHFNFKAMNSQHRKLYYLVKQGIMHGYISLYIVIKYIYVAARYSYPISYGNGKDRFDLLLRTNQIYKDFLTTETFDFEDINSWKLFVWKTINRDNINAPKIKVYNFSDIKGLPTDEDPHSLYLKIKDFIDFTDLLEITMPYGWSNYYLTFINWPEVDRLVTNNPTDKNIAKFMKIPGPTDNPDIYSDKRIMQIAKDAKTSWKNAISLYDAVFVLACNSEATDHEKLWKFVGYDSEIDPLFPKWNYLIADNKHSRAMFWFWILCRFCIYSECDGKPSYFFYKLAKNFKNPLPTIHLRKIENNKFVEIKANQEQSPNDFLLLSDLESLFLKIQNEAGISIEVPVLFVGNSGSANESKTRYSFYKELDYWKIGPEGKETHVKDLKGLKYLQFLIRHSNTIFPARDVFNFDYIPEHGTDHLDSLDLNQNYEKQIVGNKKNIQNQIEHFKDELQQAEVEGNSEKMSEIEKKIHQLKKFKNSEWHNRIKDSAEDKCRLNLYKCIKRATLRIDEIRGMNKLINRKINLKTGYNLAYIQNDDIQWILDKPS